MQATIAIEELNGTNCKTYLLTAGDEAALVDPVRERLEMYRRLLVDRGLRLRMVLETHTHADHLMLGRAARDVLGAPVVMHEASPSPLVGRHVVDGEALALGGAAIGVMHTPGHTPDSVCYLVDGAVLTGDTLLIGGSGRTDFPGGDAGAQYDAVVGRLFALPDATVVWPGHDYRGQTRSTIAAERATNPRFVGKDRAAYVALMGALGLPFPERVQQALQVNQSGLEAEEIGFAQVAEIAAMPEVRPDELAALLASPTPPLLLDVREPEEFVGPLGHVGGSLLVPLDALAGRLPKLLGYHDHEVVVICRAGARSASAAAILQRAGFTRVRNLAGGMLHWARAGLPVQR
jgi:sulfur dioxygenase